VGIRGRKEDRVNHGRLGPKGLYGSWQGETHQDRLTRPLIRVDGQLVETDWNTAMSRIVDRSKELLATKGPLSHGFYTSGQLFLEEYYALGSLGKAGIGTPHMDGNTRLCTATAAAALKDSFGADGQPGSYTDIDECSAIFLYGHNMDLYVLVHHIDVTWMMVGPAAQGDRDKELQAVVKQCEGDSELQIRWLRTRMKQAAPQALLVAE
jgi:anaerobic selenocysteine-containing dehydrogenase